MHKLGSNYSKIEEELFEKNYNSPVYGFNNSNIKSSPNEICKKQLKYR